MKKLLCNSFFVIFSLVTSSVFSQTNYYVKVSGVDSNDGASWSSAITLDKALSMALSGDVIHVAEGTYAPTMIITGGNATDDKDKTFEISKNISIIGGYDNEAITGGKPDFKTNPTILSGNTVSGKVYHTLSITAPKEKDQSVHLQGITIKDGQASDVATFVTVNGVKFQRNYAGGLIVGGANAILEDCTITNNSSLTFAAGISVFGASVVTFKRCDITNNSGTSNGGGLWNDNSTVYLMDCNVSNNTTISNNTSGAHSAAYYGRAGSVGVMVNCTLFGNKTASNADGGAINLHGGGVLDVISSTITANSARNGGGIRCQANSTIKLINSIVSGNQATTEGNDISNAGTTTFRHSIISTKTYDEQGGEISVSPAFDFTKMLVPLADNGGTTQTCLLLEENNPARNHGMSQTQLTALASTYAPELSTELISKDQIGNSRSDCSTIGALVLKKIASSINSPNVENRKIYSYNGVLNVETLENENITLYTITGHLVHSQKASDSLTKISGLARGIYILNINNQSFKVRI